MPRVRSPVRRSTVRRRTGPRVRRCCTHPTSAKRDRVSFLTGIEPGLRAPQPTLGLRDSHNFPGAEPIEVGLEFGDHDQHVKWQPPDRIGRVRPAEAQPGTSGGQFTGDARVSGRDRASLSSFVTTRVSPSRNAANAFADGQHLPPEGPMATTQAGADLARPAEPRVLEIQVLQLADNQRQHLLASRLHVRRHLVVFVQPT